MAHHLVGQFSDASMGLSQLRDAGYSRNNILIGLLAGGEGWHNNHHAAPTSARHGHKWWEFDVAWLTIRVLGQLGLATKVCLPSPNLEATFQSRTTPRSPRA